MKNLKSSYTLPNGSVLKNRIAKSALSENMGSKKHAPTKPLINAYKTWAQGNPGLLITGNIMVDYKAIGEPRNVVVEDDRDMPLLKEWADTVKGTGVHLWPQINHPGRQAFSKINKDVVAPSAIPVRIKGLKSMFTTPRALTEEEILNIIDRFGNAAKIMKEAGFTGAQIHGAHGYLVSQFLSPLSNTRTDQWGGSLENRARFVIEVYRNIREKVGPKYPVGIKINSADFQRGGFTEEESLEVLRLLDQEGMDLLEISGGSYEAPAMMGQVKKQSTIDREVYFLDYIKKARKVTTKPLMLTGGFRTVSLMEEALSENHLDVVGLGRPFCTNPHLADDIFERGLKKINTPTPLTGIKAIDKVGGLDVIWYAKQIKLIGEGKEPDLDFSGLKAFGHNTWLMIQKAFAKN